MATMGAFLNHAAAGALLLVLSLGAARHRARAQNSPGDFLEPQNAARAEVGVGKLSWDATLTAYARRYAEKRAYDCALVHSKGPYGENIFCGGAGRRWGTADAVAAWVGEREYYNCARNRCAWRRSCGHYTQVAWAKTKRVGCAAAECYSGGTFIVCSYDPPGNWNGESPYPCGHYAAVAAA
ncbi:hypothetical protein ACP4OV_001462 [Aristida adscensionis]